MLDYLVYGAVIWVLATLLNKTVFSVQPATNVTAWVLAIVVFFVNLFALSALKYFRFHAVSESLGVTLQNRNPLDIAGAFAFTFAFFALLRKAPKHLSTRNGNVSESTLPPIPTKGSSFSPLPIESSVREHTMQSSLTSRVPVAVEPVETVSTAEPGEELWAQALTEFEGSDRRPGLWAKSFAEAQGNENLAKVKYLEQRVRQLGQEMSLAASNAQRVEESEREKVEKLTHRFLSGNRLESDEVAHLARYSAVDKSLSNLREGLRGETLLHCCARLELAEEAEILLRQGANSKAPDGSGRAPWALAPTGTGLRTTLYSAYLSNMGSG